MGNLQSLPSLSDAALLADARSSARSLHRSRVRLAYALLIARSRSEDLYEQMRDDADLADKTAKNYMATASHVPIAVVPETAHLSWLEQVKHLPAGEQKRVLDRAALEGWTAQDIRDTVRPNLGQDTDRLWRGLCSLLDKLLSLTDDREKRRRLQLAKNALQDGR